MKFELGSGQVWVLAFCRPSLARTHANLPFLYKRRYIIYFLLQYCKTKFIVSNHKSVRVQVVGAGSVYPDRCQI